MLFLLLTVLNGGFERGCRTGQIPIGVAIQANPVIGHRLQWDIRVVNIPEHLLGEVLGAGVVTARARHVGADQRDLAVQGQCDIRILVRPRHPGVQQVLQLLQQWLNVVEPVEEEQRPDLEHEQPGVGHGAFIRDVLKPAVNQFMESRVDQVVAILFKNLFKPVPVLKLDQLDDGFLEVVLLQEPADGPRLERLVVLGVGLLEAQAQRFPEQVVKAEPLIARIQWDDEKVGGNQAIQDGLAVLPLHHAVAQRGAEPPAH